MDPVFIINLIIIIINPVNCSCSDFFLTNNNNRRSNNYQTSLVLGKY